MRFSLQSTAMTLYEKTLQYFYDLSAIPRRSHEERKVRNWLVKWAKKHHWDYRIDTAGNLLVLASTNDEGRIRGDALCLQSHMDMVCVSEEEHNWKKEGVTIVEKNGILYGKNTTLGADNGIGVAGMMAIAEESHRPNLELLFTVEEEVGCTGAINIKLPIKSPYALNLDWCQSKTLGIGCGGTLKIGCQYIPRKIHHEGSILKIRISGLRGGHSGAEIGGNQGNAIIELANIMRHPDIRGIADIKGGEAANAIPRSARAVVAFDGEYFDFEKFLLKEELRLQKCYKNPEIAVTVKIIDDEEFDTFYEKDIALLVADIGSGVQKKQSDGTVVSSWNIGKIRTKKNKFRWAIHIRTNEKRGIQNMRGKILRKIAKFPAPLSRGKECLKGHSEGRRSRGVVRKVQCIFSQSTPVWNQDPRTNFVRNIRAIVNAGKKEPIDTAVFHATIEVGLLAKKFPKTEWMSLGATCHDMHTPREHIALADLEEFCERLEKIVQSFL